MAHLAMPILTSDSSKADCQVTLQCLRCAAILGFLSNAQEIAICSNCDWTMERRDGIWKALLPDRTAYFSQFIHDYESIRAAEGRGSSDDDYYLQLPYRDISGNNEKQWAIRARTYRCIQQHVLPSLFMGSSSKLSVLDLGAGNGWMSYRLALAG